MKAPAVAVVALLLAAGCADTSASSAFHRAGEPGDVTAALAREDRAAPALVNASGQPRVYLVTTDARVVAADLRSGSVLWQQQDDPAGRLAVARSAVIYARANGALVGRDGTDGRLLWDHPLANGRRRVGYAADADALYDLTCAAANPRDVELVRYDVRSGGVDWRQSLEGEAGAPAARGGLVAVPRRSQFVSLIDGHNGRVMAEILSRQEAALFVRALPEGLFFGSRGIYLASAATAGGAREGGGYLEATLPKLIAAPYERDMYRPEEASYSALDRKRVLWRVTADGQRPGFVDGLVVSHVFRFFFGIDAASGKLRWAYSHPAADAVASTIGAERVLFVSSVGEAVALDLATGRRAWSVRIGAGLPVRGATFDAEGFAPDGGSAPAAQPLSRTLSGILFDRDRRFDDVKLYAIGELAALGGPEVTRELLRAMEAPDLPPAVVQRATEALASRRDPASVSLYAEVLRVHGDYVEDRHSPRLDVLARAVAATRATAALPVLLDHLRLPETDPAAVRDIADATLTLTARPAVPMFEEYLVQYRADPQFIKNVEPLTAAADVLLKLGGPSARATLLFLAEEPRTIEPLRSYLQSALYAGDEVGGEGAR